MLAKYGYRVAHVTMSFSDWQFTPAYARCAAAGNSAAVTDLERMYMDEVKQNIAVARKTAQMLYGHDIPYVLLMHVSAMSAHMMPQVIQLYRDAGFRFVSLAKRKGILPSPVTQTFPAASRLAMGCCEGEASDLASAAGSYREARATVSWRTNGDDPVTVRVADLRSTEFGPTEIVKVPGSTTFFISDSKSARSSGVSSNVTVRRSPG